MCCGCDTYYIVSVHIQCQASIYTLSLCRVHSWQVRLAKQETLTPPGHLVSPLVCRGPWMSTVVLFCWCDSDSASVLLYFTLIAQISRPISPELVMFLDFWVSNIPRYFCFAWYSSHRLISKSAKLQIKYLLLWRRTKHMTNVYWNTRTQNFREFEIVIIYPPPL